MAAPALRHRLRRNPLDDSDASVRVARVVAEKIGPALGQTLVVENQAGGGGSVGATETAKAAPDGHPLLNAITAIIQQPSLMDKLPYDPLKDFAAIGLAGFTPTLLVVAAAVGWALARFVFEFAWSVSLWVPLLGALAGAVLALAAGWWGLREVLRRPVVETLRRAAQ